MLLYKSTIIGMGRRLWLRPLLVDSCRKVEVRTIPAYWKIIVPDAQASVRWVKHGYPSSLAKWHHHPHIEIHLIREGTGLMMAGNAVVPYEAGQVALIGSNLPHNWVSDIAPGERLRQRDVVCHVRPETIRLLMSGFPETSGFAMVLRRAGQALVLSGESARQAGSILESMEEHSLACRVSDLIRVLDVFAHASADESYTVVASGYDPAVCSGAESVVNDAIEYISSHLSGEISLDLAARQAGMSVSAFSRLFKRAAGIRFSDFVRRLRIGHACRLLTTTNQSVASIRRACGYGNARISIVVSLKKQAKLLLAGGKNTLDGQDK